MSSPLRIVTALPLSEDLLGRIQSVSEALEVKHLSRTQRYVYRDGRPLWAGYNEPPDDTGESEDDARAALEAALSSAEILLTNPIVPTDILDRAPALRWIQLTSAGADRLIDSDIVRSGRIQVATASGLHAVPISEYVIGAVLSSAKGFPASLSAQREEEWRPHWPREVEDSTIAIIGLGAIGSRVGELAKALGMRVLASRRSCTQRTSGADIGQTAVDEVVPALDLDYLLAEADYVVLSMPLTEESTGLIGEEQLRTMKPSAVIINIARGKVIDQPALIAALRKGQIAGAFLDVTDPEPLPAGHELWSTPNVVITPHISGGTPRYMDRAIEIFCDNLHRQLSGKPLRNVVDPARGY